MHSPLESPLDDQPPPRVADRFRPPDASPSSPVPDRLALVSLIAANVLPILVAILFGWDISDVVLFYWLENIIIGLWVIPRILFAQAEDTGTVGVNQAKFFLVPFFCFHYFFFCFVHGVFITVFTSGFSGGPPMHSPGELLRASLGGLSTAGMLALAGLVISHGISFFRNYIGHGEYRQAHPMGEMFRPYPRVVILHVCIIFGGFAVMMLGSPMALVVLLMIGKTILDATLHTASHGGNTPWGHPERTATP
jgi:hypothetical protein